MLSSQDPAPQLQASVSSSVIWDSCVSSADLLVWLEDPEFTGEQWLFLQSGFSLGATSCRKPSQPPRLGGPSPLLTPSATCDLPGGKEGGREGRQANRQAGGHIGAPGHSLSSLLLLTVTTICRSKFRSLLPSLHPHTQTPLLTGCRGPSIPLSVPSSQGTHSHMGSLFIELSSFPGWLSRQTDLG